MNEKKYRLLLYLITAVILVTLAIQGYWNYKNYQESERQLKSDLQTALDQSIEDYFTIKAKNNTISFIQDDPNWDLESTFDQALLQIDLAKRDSYGNMDYRQDIIVEGTKVVRGIRPDSLDLFNSSDINAIELKRPETMREQRETRRLEITEDTIKSRLTVESLEFEENGENINLKELTNKIVFSISSNIVNLQTLDSLMLPRLKERSIKIDYDLNYRSKDTSYIHREVKAPSDSVLANTKLLAKYTDIKLKYTGTGKTLLKRSITSIILSLVLISSIIFCLFYLLNIIRRQKALGEMKNDLISNITHEFKTPIATASAALEGVQHFNTNGDTQKTNRYLGMGREQLQKLNNMVEKLLETATIDQGSLILQHTEVNLNELIGNLLSRFPDHGDKQIRVEIPQEQITIMADAFHLENSISNLLDNAFKYGGDSITLKLEKRKGHATICVNDNGTSLKKGQEKLIFDKFYRVPQGNTHNVKGHGIGLFYTRSIIEKHRGTIMLQTQPATSFIINLPYA